MLRPTFVWCSVLALALALLACGSRSSLRPGGSLTLQGGSAPGGGGTGGTGAQPGGAGGAGGQAGAGGIVTQTISLMPESLLESESHLAVAPNGFIAVAWIAVNFDGFPFVAYAISTDDGHSWLPPAPAPIPGGKYSGDPVMAVDSAGNFYLTYIGFDIVGSEPDNMGVYVAKAAAGATSFSPVVEVTDPAEGLLYDKPWITVSNEDTVLVSYAAFSLSESFLMMGYSGDGGQSFERLQVAYSSNLSTFFNLAFPCAPAVGQNVWVTYLRADGFSIDVVLHRSPDGGWSWFPDDALIVSNEPFVAYQDPNCVAFGSEIWVSYGESSDPIEGDTTQKLTTIRMARSTDLGLSVAQRFDVHDAQAASYFMLPNLALETGDAVHLVTYAGEQDEDPNGMYRRSRIPLEPGPLDPSLLVREPIVFKQSRSDPGWLGDYTGVAVRDGKLYTVFPENTQGFSHVVFYRMPIE
jgi:hypothetical protein